MCQICLQPFVAPTDTPCSHTFCQVASSSQFSPHLMSQSSYSLDIPGGPHGPSELSSSRTTLTISPFCKQAYLVASHPLLGPLPSRRQVPSSYPPAPSTLLGTPFPHPCYSCQHDQPKHNGPISQHHPFSFGIFAWSLLVAIHLAPFPHFHFSFGQFSLTPC